MSDDIEARTERRLFGLPGAETLYSSIAEVWESEIEHEDPSDGDEFAIEEFTVRDNVDFVPTADLFIEWMVETAADEMGLTDGAEEWVDAAHRASRALVDQLDKARATLANHVWYWRADKQVGTHTLVAQLMTVQGEHGPYRRWEPTVNGEPLYREATDE